MIYAGGTKSYVGETILSALLEVSSGADLNRQVTRPVFSHLWYFRGDPLPPRLFINHYRAYIAYQYFILQSRSKLRGGKVPAR